MDHSTPTSAAPRLQLQDITYRYPGGTSAVQGFALDTGPGVIGLLGPNGAGKSTLMRMIATLLAPQQGRVLWNGHDTAADPAPLRAALGYLPQDFGAYPLLSVREFLVYLAAVKNLPPRLAAGRVQVCLEAMGLAAAAARPVGSLSGGMRQRVGIAQALLNDPQLLVVDEPTVGLDPEERLRFRHLVAELAGLRIVLLSTHIVPDIEASASRLVVMAAGRKHFDGPPEDLLARAAGAVWECVVAPSQLADWRRRHRISGARRVEGGVKLRVVGDEPPGGEPAAPTLEEAYLLLLDRDGAAALRPDEVPL